MKDKQLFIQNEGDDDANLWVVVDEKNQSYFSSRDLSKAREFVQNFQTKEISPTAPNFENSFIAELCRENCFELSEIDCLPVGG